jgi:hypothetical protein
MGKLSYRVLGKITKRYMEKGALILQPSGAAYLEGDESSGGHNAQSDPGKSDLCAVSWRGASLAGSY